MSRETEQWKKQLDREKENKNKIASKYQIQTVFYAMTEVLWQCQPNRSREKKVRKFKGSSAYAYAYAITWQISFEDFLH